MFPPFARIHHLSRLHRDEDGASYGISLLLALPLYVAMVGLAAEVASLTSTGMTLDAAASAAARSAATWLPLEGSAEAKWRQVQRAAVAALVPASGSEAAESGTEFGAVDAEAEEAFVAAYRQFTPHALPTDDYLRQKYRWTAQSTRVTLTPANPQGGDQVTVRVEFLAPIRVPGFGRWLGDVGSGNHWSRRLSREVTFTLEPTPRQSHPLGITYDRLR
jgi:Flp pilus assembly protein TadG